MTVAELIALLRQQDQDDLVRVCLGDIAADGRPFEMLGNAESVGADSLNGRRFVALYAECEVERPVPEGCHRVYGIGGRRKDEEIDKKYAEALARVRKLRAAQDAESERQRRLMRKKAKAKKGRAKRRKAGKK